MIIGEFRGNWIYKTIDNKSQEVDKKKSDKDDVRSYSKTIPRFKSSSLVNEFENYQNFEIRNFNLFQSLF